MSAPKIEAVTTTPQPTSVVVVPSRLQKFTLNHPRIAKVIGIAALTTLTMGAVAVFKNRKQIAAEAEAKVDELKDTFDSKA